MGDIDKKHKHSGTGVSISGNDQRLLRHMQIINLLTLPIFVTPLYFKHVLRLPAVWFSYKYEYYYSFKQFVPDIFLFGYYAPIPLHALDVGSVTVYFPGLAIDCVVGTIQGVLLGLSLYRRGPRGNMRAPTLPATSLIMFGAMELVALPLHCLKEVPWLDIESGSLLTNLLFWMDTFFTSSTYVAMFLSGLIECRFLPPEKQGLFLWVLPVTGSMTVLGVFLPNRWIECVLHMLFLSAFTTPLLFMTGRRVKRLGCPHGYAYMKSAKLCFVILGYLAWWFFPTLLSKATGGQVDPLTAIFVGCRVGMVQYYAYCMSQGECDCWSKNDGNPGGLL